MSKVRCFSRQLLSVAVLLLQSPTVCSLGGLFGKRALPSDERELPAVELLKSSVLYGVQRGNGDNNAKMDLVTLQMQLEYRGAAFSNELAWILPLPVAPSKVQMGSGILFHALHEETQPSFTLTIQNVSTNIGGEEGEGPTLIHDLENDEDGTSIVYSTHASSILGRTGSYTYTNVSYCQAEDLLHEESCFRSSDQLGGQNITAENESGLPIISSKPSFVMGSAGMFDYTIVDDGAEGVLQWLEQNGFHFELTKEIPEEQQEMVLQAQNTSFNATSGTVEKVSLEDLLLDYEAAGYVFMAIQLDNLDTMATKQGTTHPLMVQYRQPARPSAATSTTASDRYSSGNTDFPDPPSPLHRLPVSLSSWTAAPSASMQVYFLSESGGTSGSSSQNNRRAIPLNYLDVELDNGFVDWLGCYNKATEEDTAICFQEDYVQRYRDIAEQLIEYPIWMTEYAGPIQTRADGDDRDVINFRDILSIPQGFTVILAAQSNWLSFLTNLQNRGVPPSSIVLQIIDRYVPPKSFGNTDEDCMRLDHLYLPQQPALMRRCYNAFVPPSDSWSFDSTGLASNLDKWVFQPSRNARDWMAPFNYLTRMYGELLNTETFGQQHEDPYFVFSSYGSRRIENVFSASAVPICDGNGPLALEITVQPSLQLHGEDSTFWHPARYTCGSTWAKTEDGPFEYFQYNDTTVALPSNESEAVAFRVCDIGFDQGRIVRRNKTTGQIDPQELEEAVLHCQNMLGSWVGTSFVEDSDDDGTSQNGNGGDQQRPPTNLPGTSTGDTTSNDDPGSNQQPSSTDEPDNAQENAATSQVRGFAPTLTTIGSIVLSFLIYIS